MLFLQFDLIKGYLNINLFCVTFRFCAYMKTSVWKKSKTSDESLFNNKSLIFSVLVLCNFGLLIVDHILFCIVSSVKCFSTCFDGNRKQIMSFLVRNQKLWMCLKVVITDVCLDDGQALRTVNISSISYM